ncbi:hypothetical protein C7C46_04550 [Streptomyces tateyamensis]|uniref:Leucine rich repeat variant n=1 Tax=Streptomyces tateyamensis TaxID=565073 RepID=A0A2V4NLY2_9ACTN|nr:hypothetical protein [Streptomyces tateyamensis]PYC87449.1 hypothetical protein C7C46_04550 [Streptomyces tateyamensis]
MNHALLGLAVNPALPTHLVDRLIGAADDELAAELARRPELSSAQVRALAARSEWAAVRLAYEGRLKAADVDPAVQPLAALALLDEGAGLPHWARYFAAHPCVEHREKLARCPGLPADVARSLADDPEIGVVAALAAWGPGHLAAELARHPHAEVRRGVAGNGATPPELLAALLTGEGLPPASHCRVCDREEVPFVHAPDCPRGDCELLPGDACDGSHQSAVRDAQWQALHNPATPAWAVARSVDHWSALLRELVAAREGLPPQIYARLATDPIPMVRAPLAKNPSIDEALIRRLAEDAGHDVRRSLALHPSLPLEVLARIAHLAKLGSELLPRVATATPAEVADLAAAADPTLRMVVAQRRDLPDEIRDALARDEDAKVLKAIAPHPGLSEAQLLAMIDRHGPRVAAKAATNPDATATVLERLTRQPASRKALREIARHPNASLPALLACLTDPRARPIAAARPELPADVLIELLADEDWQVATAAGANPSLPADVMSGLVLPR